jgi:hypothetical protein
MEASPPGLIRDDEDLHPLALWCSPRFPTTFLVLRTSALPLFRPGISFGSAL